MKTSTKVIAAVIAVVGTLAQTDLCQQFVASHPAISAAIAAISALTTLFHRPNAT
jgi:hypothetical protein